MRIFDKLLGALLLVIIAFYVLIVAAVISAKADDCSKALWAKELATVYRNCEQYTIRDEAMVRVAMVGQSAMYKRCETRADAEIVSQFLEVQSNVATKEQVRKRWCDIQFIKNQFYGKGEIVER